uniref:Fe2OG dioxygenase domain-containing protein n=1 Tax=Glossina pallidipes TaxID=7398 RepID=A0A1A9ZNI5_GLOPL
MIKEDLAPLIASSRTDVGKIIVESTSSTTPCTGSTSSSFAQEESSKYLAILNAGLATGLTEELVLLTAEQYGKVAKLLMLPNKSYCFLECMSQEDAELIFGNMHGKANIGQNETVIYMSYFQQLPALGVDTCSKSLPKGLVLIKDFISEDDEFAILEAIDMESVTDDSLKHRKIKHFGYEFLYGVNNVDVKQPLDRKIPKECKKLWVKLAAVNEREHYNFEWLVPDQLTVNAYEPGQGIPPHVDTHSAFLDPILSLSLKSDVVMDFRNGAQKVSVILPRRSLLIMSGESRFNWTHGITPRLMDVVITTKGNLTVKKRKQRISLTFRKLRKGDCNCDFPLFCDSKRGAIIKERKEIIQQEKAVQLEEFNVHSVYEQIAEHFNETRHTPWPKVTEFLHSFPQGSVLLDVGCGNGKYLDCNSNILNVGCDRSRGLLQVCKSLHYNILRCDCLQLPIRCRSIDGCISIAVIHHLSTAERRLKSLQELLRVLRPSGKALIYVWAKNQSGDNKKSSYLRQNKALNKEKTTAEQQRQETLKHLEEKAKQSPVVLPIHTNRTEFLEQDVLVPWKLKSKETQKNTDTFLRYYHVFEKEELENLVKQIEGVTILCSYYDQGNHCVIIEKIANQETAGKTIKTIL